MRMIFRLIALLIPILNFAVPQALHRYTFPPFISGDLFREYSDFAYDDNDTSMNPKGVMHGNTVFVQTDLLKTFFKTVHPLIVNPYILITHNSDASAPGPFRGHLDDPMILAWFGENHDGYDHPKMHVIPMGTANFNWPNGNGDTIKKVIAKNCSKEHLTHMGFTIQTNYNERWNVFRQFSQAPFCYRTIKKVYEGYLTDVASSKFEISPLGFALDTYRLWECLYVGTIPIVRTSSLDALYEGLPVLIIKDWKTVTQAFLEEKYLEFSKKTFNMEKTTMEYWIRQMDACKVQ